MLPRRSAVAQKGQKESPVQAIEIEISRGEPGSKMTMGAVSHVTLSDHKTIPQLGFGVFQIEPEETAKAVSKALEIGYRNALLSPGLDLPGKPVLTSPEWGIKHIRSALSGWKAVRTLYIYPGDKIGSIL